MTSGAHSSVFGCGQVRAMSEFNTGLKQKQNKKLPALSAPITSRFYLRFESKFDYKWYIIFKVYCRTVIITDSYPMWHILYALHLTPCILTQWQNGTTTDWALDVIQERIICVMEVSWIVESMPVFWQCSLACAFFAGYIGPQLCSQVLNLHFRTNLYQLACYLRKYDENFLPGSVFRGGGITLYKTRLHNIIRVISW